VVLPPRVDLPVLAQHGRVRRCPRPNQCALAWVRL
jgi:hypothetical protein